MKPRNRSLRAAALPSAMLVVMVASIYAVTIPNVAANGVNQQMVAEEDHLCMMSAMTALEIGRAIMYYELAINFTDAPTGLLPIPAIYRAPAPGTMVIPVANRTATAAETGRMNGFFFTIMLNLGSEPANKLLEVCCWKEDPTQPTATRVVRRVRLRQHVSLAPLAQYNFANANFTGGGTLGPRNWYGNVLMAADGNLWDFDDNGYFQSFFADTAKGERVETTVLNKGSGQTQNNTRFYNHATGTFTTHSSMNMSTASYGKDYGFSAGSDRVHNEFSAYSTLAGRIPTSMDIRWAVRSATENNDANLDPDLQNTDGLIYKEATRAGNPDGIHVPNAAVGTEVFLTPAGEVWTRPFGGTATMGPPNGWVKLSDQAGSEPGKSKTILFDGNIMIRGFVTGRLTIASRGSIMINGNIVNLDESAAHLGLVSPSAILLENRRVESGQIAIPRSIINSSNQAVTWTTPINQYYNQSSSSQNGYVGKDPSTGYFHTAAANSSDSAAPTMASIAAENGQTLNAENFNFIANKVLPDGGYPAGWTSNGAVNQQLQMMNGQDTSDSTGTGGIPANRMPRKNAKVHASLASGWYLGVAVAGQNSSSWNSSSWASADSSLPGGSTDGRAANLRYEMRGGSIEFRGTYAMNTGIDQMAAYGSTNPNNGQTGSVNYDVNPFQRQTAPGYFIPSGESYPQLVFGTFNRLE